MARVYIKIPKSGLGNMMLVWAYGIAFAELNRLPVTVSRWWGFRWGALLRREKKNRLYRGYFKEERLLKRFVSSARTLFSKKVHNPGLKKVESVSARNVVYIFDKLPAHNYFTNLYPHLSLIREKLFSLLTPRVMEEFNGCLKPEIAVHVRRGDFKYANHITSEEYFIGIIQAIRNTTGENLKVTIFTDGGEHEISKLLRLSNTEVANNKFDITDILQMSQSRYLLLSRDSSFSYWAAFLSEAVVIMHSGDWQKRIKPDSGSYREIRCNGAEDLNGSFGM